MILFSSSRKMSLPKIDHNCTNSDIKSRVDSFGIYFSTHRNFSSSTVYPDRLWAPPSLLPLPNGYLWLCPQEKSGRGVKLTTRLHLAPRLRMCGAQWLRSPSPLTTISEATSKSLNGDPEHCHLSEERSPARKNPQQILVFCTFGGPRPTVIAPWGLRGSYLLHRSGTSSWCGVISRQRSASVGRYRTGYSNSSSGLGSWPQLCQFLEEIARTIHCNVGHCRDRVSSCNIYAVQQDTQCGLNEWVLFSTLC